MKGRLTKDPTLVSAMEGLSDNDALWGAKKATKGMGRKESNPNTSPPSNFEGWFGLLRKGVAKAETRASCVLDRIQSN